jgi:hypothetical protein
MNTNTPFNREHLKRVLDDVRATVNRLVIG